MEGYLQSHLESHLEGNLESHLEGDLESHLEGGVNSPLFFYLKKRGVRGEKIKQFMLCSAHSTREKKRYK